MIGKLAWELLPNLRQRGPIYLNPIPCGVAHRWQALLWGFIPIPQGSVIQCLGVETGGLTNVWPWENYLIIPRHSFPTCNMERIKPVWTLLGYYKDYINAKYLELYLAYRECTFYLFKLPDQKQILKEPIEGAFLWCSQKAKWEDHFSQLKYRSGSLTF